MNDWHVEINLHECNKLIGEVMPPTSFPLNEFTSAFQDIINTYGIPNYKEFNPTFFTIITFPFLFGVMFGDVAHGSMLMFIGFFLIWFAKWWKVRSVAKYWYLIFLMGFFSTFCGFLYNDFASIPFEMHDSCLNEGSDCVYPFGVDYWWYFATNQLNFFNSMKMKIAIIFGVS